MMPVKSDYKPHFVRFVLLFAMTMLMFTAGAPYSPAYDGDVDFMAPYMTVDPETGELITVDPKNDPAPAQNQTAQVTHPASESATAGETTGPETEQASPAILIAAGVIIALVATGIVVAAARRKNRLSNLQT